MKKKIKSEKGRKYKVQRIYEKLKRAPIAFTSPHRQRSSKLVLDGIRSTCRKEKR